MLESSLESADYSSESADSNAYSPKIIGGVGGGWGGGVLAGHCSRLDSCRKNAVRISLKIQAHPCLDIQEYPT